MLATPRCQGQRNLSSPKAHGSGTLLARHACLWSCRGLQKATTLYYYFTRFIWIQVVLRGEHLEEFNGKNVQPQTREFLIRKAKLRDQEKSKCSMDGHSAGQRTQNIVLGKGNSSIDVQEARPLRSSKFAQLRIPSSSGVAMSLTSRKGLASVCTPPNACTREDLKAAAQARS